jgi:CheY-like chemotaxis protein
MTGMSGFELCAAVRADPGLRGIPVILTTSALEPGEQECARALAAVCLVRTADLRELLETLAQCLRG